MSENATLSPLSDALARGRELIQKRDFRSAWEVLTQARKEHMSGAPANEQEEMFYCLGVCFNGMERPQEALPHLVRALQLAEQNGDASGQARTLEELGSANHQRGDYRQAEHFFDRALKIYQKLENRPGIARNFRNLGGTRVDLGQAQAALADFQEARRLFAEEKDTEGVATCVVNMTLLTYRYHGRAATIEEYKKHLAQGDCSHFLVYNNIGFLQLLEEQLKDAEENLKLGVRDCEERGVHDDNIGLLYLNLGILSCLEGRYQDADDYLHKATVVFTNFPVGRAVEILLLPGEAGKHNMGRFFPTEDGHKLAVAFLNTAVVAHFRGDAKLALELGQKAVEFDKEQGYPYAVLGWLYKAEGDDAQATANFRKATGREPKNELFKKYLDLVNPYIAAKVGRNDPCPCGSRKKFKKCHGAV